MFEKLCGSGWWYKVTLWKVSIIGSDSSLESWDLSRIGVEAIPESGAWQKYFLFCVSRPSPVTGPGLLPPAENINGFENPNINILGINLNLKSCEWLNHLRPQTAPVSPVMKSQFSGVLDSSEKSVSRVTRGMRISSFVPSSSSSVSVTSVTPRIPSEYQPS